MVTITSFVPELGITALICDELTISAKFGLAFVVLRL